VKTKLFTCICCVASVVLCPHIASATLDYLPVPEGAAFGTTGVLYEQGGDTSWGGVRIDYWYWQDGEGDWHYAYQVINNYDGGTPNDPTDDYHFGWRYVPGIVEDPDLYLGIRLFSVSGLDILAGYGPPDLAAPGSAGSSAGGDPWTATIDPANTGIDWVNQTGAEINPTRWLWKNKGGGTWEIYTGDNSTADGPGTQYFQLTSSWGPGMVDGTVLAEGFISGVYTELLAEGDIVGPAQIPEPSTCLLLGFAALSLLSGRRGWC